MSRWSASAPEALKKPPCVEDLNLAEIAEQLREDIARQQRPKTRRIDPSACA